MARPLQIEFPGAVHDIKSRRSEKIEDAVERCGYTQREVVSISRIMRQRKGMPRK